MLDNEKLIKTFFALLIPVGALLVIYGVIPQTPCFCPAQLLGQSNACNCLGQINYSLVLMGVLLMIPGILFILSSFIGTKTRIVNKVPT